MRKWNPYQPYRQDHSPSARTHIDFSNSKYDVLDPKNIAAQVMLYKHSRADLFPRQVAIDELYHYLIFDFTYLPFSKRQLGQTALQATKYDPRVLKGKTKDNPKACMTYVWREPEDLQHGLEWLLSMWIWRIEESVKGPEDMLEIFDEMARAEAEELIESWIEPMEDPNPPWVPGRAPQNLSWAEMWEKFEWEMEVDAPSPTERPVLRDLS